MLFSRFCSRPPREARTCILTNAYPFVNTVFSGRFRFFLALLQYAFSSRLPLVFAGSSRLLFAAAACLCRFFPGAGTAYQQMLNAPAYMFPLAFWRFIFRASLPLLLFFCLSRFCFAHPVKRALKYTIKTAYYCQRFLYAFSSLILYYYEC